MIEAFSLTRIAWYLVPAAMLMLLCSWTDRCIRTGKKSIIGTTGRGDPNGLALSTAPVINRPRKAGWRFGMHA